MKYYIASPTFKQLAHLAKKMDNYNKSIAKPLFKVSCSSINTAITNIVTTTNIVAIANIITITRVT